LSLERQDAVALITLNRPAARNALNLELALALAAAIGEAQDAGCIVITGADPAFCAGLDLRNLGAERLGDLRAYADALIASQVPMIAAVNGPAVTGGFEIALACDFIVASERAAFADTHLRVGVYPGPVLVDLPRRVGMAWARQMSLTGDFVDAATALRIGIANHVTPHDQLLPFTLQRARAIAEQDRRMVHAMRSDWDETSSLPVAAARERHGEHQRAFGQNRSSDLEARRDAVLARSKSQRDH
jgi:enoyl-CoA hydratase